MTITDALNIVIDESNNDYAKTYAIAGLELGGSYEGKAVDNCFKVEIKHKATGKVMVGNELKVQILYILSNLGAWRGERAREIKKVLKNYIK